MPAIIDFIAEVRTAATGTWTSFFGSELFASPQTPLVIGIIVLLLLLVLCAVLLVKYLKRSRLFYQKCEELEPELIQTRRELGGTKDLLKEESERHKRMLTGSGAAIFQLDEEGGCVYVNSALAALVGVPDKKLFNQGLVDVLHPDDRERVLGEWQSFSSRKAPYKSSYRLQQKDGNVVHVIERGSILRDKQRRVSGYFAQVMDVSDQMRECAEARRAEQQSDWFIHQTVGGFFKLDLGEPVPVNLPVEEASELIFKQAELTACNKGLAMLYGQSVKKLTGVALKDLPGGCGPFESPAEIKSFVEAGFKISGEEGVRTDGRGNPVCLRYDVIGIVENDQLVSIWGTQHDISLQKREEEEFKHREDLLRRILNSLPGDVFVKDPRCRYLYVSHGFEETTGIPLDDWMEKTIFEVLPAAPRDINKTSIEAMKTGKLCRSVSDRGDSGEHRWIETLEKPLISADGVVEGVVGISTDVTDRTLRELELQKSEARFRCLMEQTPVAVMLADASSKMLTYANPAFCDLFGYTAEEIFTLKVDDLHSPGSRRQVVSEWNERARQTRRFEDALPCLRKDRSVVFADVGVSVGSFDGSGQTIGVYSDAAGRKQIEVELEQQRDLQTGLINNASVLVATVDPSGAIRSANDTLLELLGKDESELIGESFSGALVCEEDRELLSEAFINNEPGSLVDVEVRLEAAGGARCQTACRIRSWVDADGKADGFTVAGIDVTQQRKLEQQLRNEIGDVRTHLAECEDQLAQTAGAYDESVRVRETMTDKLTQLEETLSDREQQFEKTKKESGRREAELAGVIEELESRKSLLEESLETGRKQLEQELERHSQLDEQLQAAQETFSEDKKQIESESCQKIEILEESLQQLRAREEGMVEENATLKNKLFSTEDALQTRTEELEHRNSEWDTETEQLQALQKTQEAELRELREHEKGLSQEVAGLKDKLAGSDEALQARTTELEGSGSKWKAEVEQLKALQKTLAAELKQLRDREKEATEEVSRLTSSLSSTEQALQKRTAELKTRTSEWSAETKRLTVLCGKLEDKSTDQEKQLKQLTAERTGLEKELKTSRKEVEAGRRDVPLQIKQSTVLLKKELKTLTALKKQLETAQEKNTGKLKELEKTLRAQKSELATTSSARREEQQTFQKTRQELKQQLRQEKDNIAKLLKQTEKELAEKRSAEERWKKERKEFLAKTQELEESLRERTHELTFASVTRREEEQAFRKERKELQELIEAEKEKQARILDEAGGTTAEFRRQRDSWKGDRNALQSQIEKLETVADERAKLLEQATGQRIDLEAQLSKTRAEMAGQSEAVDEQIEQKTKDLKQQLAAQCEQEEKLKAEQQVLADRLTEMQEALNARSTELSDLLRTKQELEEQVVLEKESLAQRIELFKQKMAESLQSEQIWQQREVELKEAVSRIEEQLALRTQEVAHADGERKHMEHDIERLKKSAGEGHRMVLSLTEDLNDPLAPVLELSEAVSQEADLSPELHARLTEINQSARRLQSILLYRQELVRMESGTVCAEPEWFDLNEFLSGLTAEFTDQAEAKQLFFAFSREGDLSGRCRADLTKIRLILGTLFNHALSRTSKGQMGLHAICEPFGEGRKQLSFLLMYSGLDQDSVVTGGLLDVDGPGKPCADMTGEELKLDLIHRQIQLLGGNLCLENPSERRQLLRLALPAEYEPQQDSDPEPSESAPVLVEEPA